MITALDFGYLSQSEFDALEEKLGPVRRMLTNLLFRVRPKQVERQSVPKARPRT